MQITESITINAPVAKVWEELAKLDQVQNFITSVTRSVYATDQKSGVGAQRTCDITGIGTILETIVDWKEGERLAYTIEGMPAIVKSALSQWSVNPVGTNKTTLTVVSTIETRFGLVGAAMEKLALKPQLSSTLHTIVREFKTYMENLDLPRTLGVEAIESRVA